MSLLQETVFVGRDNTIRLVLYEDGIALNTAYPSLTPTRWLLTIHATALTEFDSDSDGVFDWDAESSILEINIGPALTSDQATSSALTTLRMFSTEFPNGVVFVHPTCTTDKLFLTICNEG